MFEKMIYVVKTDLHYYPPCMSQIRSIKSLGVNIEVWFGSSNESALEILEKENIPYYCLGEMRRNNKIGKLINWINFRKRFKQTIKESKMNRNRCVFWFGTAETALPLLGLIKKYEYYFTALELLDDKANRLKRELCKNIAQKAKGVVVCEETRAYIMQYWYGLDSLPYTMPNKPYSLDTIKNAPFSSEFTKDAVEKLKDKKFIIYQGIFQNIEYIMELAKVLNELNSTYYLVLMGMKTHHDKIIEELQKIYDKIIYIPSIPAPLHLEITSHATIGLVFYHADHLNKAFCAPNKIYEYAGFGIPAIANDIPGLVNTIGKAKAGVCIKFTRNHLVEAIHEIDDNYDQYSKNAYDFYNSTDNNKTMKEVLSQCDFKLEERGM